MELSIQAISKQYGGNFWGLRDFSLSLSPGVLALLGPNGAGKSSLMRILATITQPTSGVVPHQIAAHQPALPHRGRDPLL